MLHYNCLQLNKHHFTKYGEISAHFTSQALKLYLLQDKVRVVSDREFTVLQDRLPVKFQRCEV